MKHKTGQQLATELLMAELERYADVDGGLIKLSARGAELRQAAERYLEQYRLVMSLPLPDDAAKRAEIKQRLTGTGKWASPKVSEALKAVLRLETDGASNEG